MLRSVCGHENTHNHYRTYKHTQGFWYLCYNQALTGNFETQDHRQLASKQVHNILLRSHAEENSLQSINRITQVFIDKVVKTIENTRDKVHIIHNLQFQQVKTDAIVGE